MKNLLVTLIVLFIAVALSAVTELIDFNNTSNLTSLFNPSSYPLCLNADAGGLGGSGFVTTSNESLDEIWTRSSGVELPGVGASIAVSAYFFNTDDSGYGGLGFASHYVNASYENCMVNSPYNMGVYFHGGGCVVFNNRVENALDWGWEVGDLPAGAWLKMIFTLTNQGSNVFDASFEVWNSDSSGNLGTLFIQKSSYGLTNAYFGGATTVYPYFGFDWSRFNAMDNFEVRTIEAVIPFSGAGTGTELSPYVITSPDQLNEVRNFHDSNFILANDINLDVSPYNTGEGWVPIGDQLSSYTELDLSLAAGGSFTITGMSMFGASATTAPISLPTNIMSINQAIEDVQIFTAVQDLGGGKYKMSAFISLNLGSVTGTATTQEFATYPFSGVLNGNNKTISNLYINRASSDHQGLFAYTNGATLINLILNNFDVIGDVYSGSLLADGYNTVLSNCHANGSVTGASYTGGLVGNLDNNGDIQIDNCSSSGSVTGYSMIGGLIGYCNGSSISRCYSTSNVTNPYGFMGGLIGYGESTNLTDCYAMGTVTGGDSPQNGGLLGYSSNGTATNCYSSGAVISPNQFSGGLFGGTGSFTATGCYWNTQTSGRSNASGLGDAVATGCNTDEMTYPYNAFVGWDFTNIWIADIYPLNGGYPMLRIETPDYPNSVDVPVGVAVVTVTGGNAYNGSGYIPDITGLGLVPVQTFTFVGTGVLTISIATTAQHGIYWQSGLWHAASNTGGRVIFNIDFDMVGKGEIAVVLGNEETLPLEMSSFSATITQQNYVQLNWVTQSETGVVGYYIYRSTTNNVESAEIVSNLISAYNTSQQQAYLYTDREVEPGSWYYWIQNVDMNGESGFHGSISVVVQETGDGDTPVIPLVTSMQNIYPNPFNPSTTIAFGVDKAEHVTIQIYNVKGQLVRNLISETKQANTYRLVWNGTNDNGKPLPSGMYYARMTAGQYSATRKLVIMK